MRPERCRCRWTATEIWPRARVSWDRGRKTQETFSSLRLTAEVIPIVDGNGLRGLRCYRERTANYKGKTGCSLTRKTEWSRTVIEPELVVMGLSSVSWILDLKRLKSEVEGKTAEVMDEEAPPENIGWPIPR